MSSMQKYHWHLVLLAWLPLAACQCKCVPNQPCWPNQQEWSQFNTSVDGKLIQTSPVSLPCYDGPDSSAEACAAVTEGWWDPLWQALDPIGYDYPMNESCLLPDAGSNPPASQCSLGNSPVYAVNVTTEVDITKAILFAKEKNLRLTIKSTGHDFLQRAKGFGALSIWLYHYRGAFRFNDHNPVREACPASEWDSNTLTITGAYAWSDIYPTAWEKDLIVVGGNQNGPCSTGGWTQGGGHSPATHYYGMGADQVLSARIILASGEVVTANACENQDLFYAIRGGGPGTYGVVTELTVKTYPTVNVNVYTVVIGANGEEVVPTFLEAVTTAYSSLPELSRLGFAGYGNWVAYSESGLGGYNYTNVWFHSFTIVRKTNEEADELFKPFQDRFAAYSSCGLDVNISPFSYPDYGSYFADKNRTNAVVGGVSALSSRFLDSAALEGNTTRLREAIEVFAGEPGKPVWHTWVHHGLEATEGFNTTGSAVQPGWYDSILLDIFERDMQGFNAAANDEPFTYIRERVEPVYRELSPNTGTYMNEADWGDVNWQEDFYGIHYERLSEVKSKYDPEGVFYCQTCVGSEAWAAGENGALCVA